MNAAAHLESQNPPETVFEDGLGQRAWLPDAEGERGAQRLTLRASFAAVPAFEFALRARTARLAAFHHAGYARVRGVERRAADEPLLSIISDATPGIRVSELLQRARTRRVPIDIHASLCLIRNLVNAAAALHAGVPEATHGALAPERLVLTPQAHLVIVEHSLGAALEHLRYTPERYWSELRIPLPVSATAPRFDDRADVLQIGVVALSLVRGRLLGAEEFPDRLPDVVATTWAVSPDGGFEPLPPGLRGWLRRALQLDGTRSFASVIEARAALDVVLGAGDLLASPPSLEAFLARYQAATRDPDLPKPSVRPVPVPPAVPAAEPADAVVVIAAPWNRDPSLGSAPGVRRPRVAAETPAHPGAVVDRASRWGRLKRVGVMAATVAVMAAGVTVAARVSARSATRQASGTLQLASNPAGAEAWVDGQLRGKTPLLLVLPAGSHSVELRAAGQRRTIPVTISAGMKVTQFVQVPRRRSAPAR